PAKRGGAPKRHEFTPTAFYRRVFAGNKNLLAMGAGGTIFTTPPEDGGADEKNKKRGVRGEATSEPFFIWTCGPPDDTLVVHINRLRLNRDYAISDDGIVGRGLTSDWAVKMKDGFKDVRWHLDLAKGLASPEKPGEHLTHYAVPVRPMLGCVGVAPNSAQAPPGTGASGRVAWNLDFNESEEGATAYLAGRGPRTL